MEQSLGIKSVWHIFTKHVKFIILITVLTTFAVFLVSYFIIPPKYTSEALLYVENKDKTSENLNINDITAAQKLVNTCSILFTSDSILEKVKSDLNLPYNIKTFEKMISVKSVNQSEVLKITVETKNPDESEKIAQKLVELSKSEFSRVIKSGSIEVVSDAKVETIPTSPNIPIYTIIGFMAGLIIASLIVFLREIFDVTVNEDDDLYKIYDIPVFAEVMSFNSNVKGENKYE